MDRSLKVNKCLKKNEKHPQYCFLYIPFLVNVFLQFIGV